jgi:hypothetical protein
LLISAVDGTASTLNGLFGIGLSANVTLKMCGPVSVGVNLLTKPSGVDSVGHCTVCPLGLLTLTFGSPGPAPAVTILNGTSLPTGAPEIHN